MSVDGPPEIFWNDALEQVIKKDAEECACLFWLHNAASIWATRRNDGIQIPSIVIATITGFFSATSNLVPPIAIGALSVFVGILGTLNSYYKFSQRAEGHRIVALWYLKSYKNLESQLALPVTQRAPAGALLKELKTEIARVSETAPAIPEAIINKFKTQFKDGPVHKPIVANGLDPVKVWKDDSKGFPITPLSNIKIDIIPGART